ncbi:MAG: alpha/beta hydrolase [Bdellovibrionaceae bacterium]|nr:alpha/beta hydrolase [Pseudobdellovibrionaceae bacterium]
MPVHASKIKKISTKSGNPGLPVVVLPGGPGLSSQTMDGLTELSDSRDLYFIDPPDTGEAETPEDFDYGVTLLDLKAAIAELDVPVILLGHSFGGIWAAHLCESEGLDVRALVCLSVPFSERSFLDLRKQYEKHASAEAFAGEKKFLDNPNGATLSAWTQELGRLYFNETNIERGKEMLRRDNFSAKLFLGCMAEGALTANALLPKLKASSLPKLLLAGEADLYTTPQSQEQDAELGGFEFATVPGGAHFVHFDSPSATCAAIERFLSGHAV